MLQTRYILRTLLLAAFLLLGHASATLAQTAIPRSPSTATAAAPGLAAKPLTDQELRARRAAMIVQISNAAGLPVSATPTGTTATAATNPAGAPSDTYSSMPLPDLTKVIPTTTEPQKLSASIQILLLLSVLALAPSILLMTTCFTRIIIVLSLLRQALGTVQLPPNQVLIGLSLFITFLVMGPTWQKINAEAIQPYQKNEITQMVGLERGVGVMREFMIRQIVAGHNEEDVLLFHSYAVKGNTPPQQWSEVATTALVPAYILSELKISFLMGFRIYLPFLIIDMVISSVLISIGMQLLPPAMISLPFKLLLFVLVDGWHLVTATLLSSFN